VATLHVGDILEVRLSAHPRTGADVLNGGQVVGAVTGQKMYDLVRCLQNGYPFEAEVLVLNGGMCTVEVRAR
jgi:hypothetical protein